MIYKALVKALLTINEAISDVSLITKLYQMFSSVMNFKIIGLISTNTAHLITHFSKSGMKMKFMVNYP